MPASFYGRGGRLHFESACQWLRTFHGATLWARKRQRSTVLLSLPLGLQEASEKLLAFWARLRHVMAHSVLVKKLAAVGLEMWGHLPPPTLEKPPIRDLGHLIHREIGRAHV